MLRLTIFLAAMCASAHSFVTSVDNFSLRRSYVGATSPITMKATQARPEISRRALLSGVALASVWGKAKDVNAITGDDFYLRLGGDTNEDMDLTKFVNLLPKNRGRAPELRKESRRSRVSSDADMAETMGPEIPQGYDAVWKSGRETFVYPAEFATRIRRN